MLLKVQPAPTFSVGTVEFVFVPEWSLLGKLLHYYIMYGRDDIVLKIACIDRVKSCGPRSNMDLTYHIWSTLEIVTPIMQ